MFSIYILHSDSTERYYIGSAVNVPFRLAEHNKGKTPSTRAYRPWRLVYTEGYDTLADARRREREIKAWKNPHYMVKALRLVI